MLYRLPVALSTLLSLAAVVVATPASLERSYGLERRATGRSCGNNPTSAVVSQKEEQFNAHAPDRSQVGVPGLIPSTIPVYFHVITFNGEGDIPQVV